MKLRVLLVAILVTLVSSVLVSRSSDSQAVQVIRAPSVTIGVEKLYVQKSDSAQAKRISGRKWKVSLKRVEESTLWFADRPSRISGREKTEKFVSSWAKLGFETVPPNAVIQHSGRASTVVQLLRPRLSANSQKLTYTMLVDSDSKNRMKRTMRNVSLFIDDAGLVTSRLNLAISGALPSSQLSIRLSNASGEPDIYYAAFLEGAAATEGAIANVQIPQGNAPIENFLITGTEIILDIGDNQSGVVGDIFIEVPIVTPSTVSVVGLTYYGASGSQVRASLNGQEAQVVNNLTILSVSP